MVTPHVKANSAPHDTHEQENFECPIFFSSLKQVAITTYLKQSKNILTSKQQYLTYDGQTARI